MKLLSMVQMVLTATIKPAQRIRIEEIPQGTVLDIGGGGEGVIAQVGGARVVAVDRLRSEVEEAKAKAPDARWVVADAAALPFEDHTFDGATAFFSCMYMPEETLKQVFGEARRVLKVGGELWIWDAEMASGGPVFAIRLQIDLPSRRRIRTAYGVRAKEQTAGGIGRLLGEAGLEVVETTRRGRWFFIRARSPA